MQTEDWIFQYGGKAELAFKLGSPKVKDNKNGRSNVFFGDPATRVRPNEEWR